VRQIDVSKSAWMDIDRLEDWLIENEAPYAWDLGVALRDAMMSLQDFSERGRHSGGGTLRELIVPFRTWSYVITYRVTVSSVIIARIHHGLEDR
jgi:plasmid stabilization system protein ParE